MSTTVRLEPRNPAAIVPLSATQQAYWRMFEANKYSERVCHAEMRIKRAVVPTLIQQSLNILIHRHEVLRTRYLLVDGVPQAQIEDATDHTLDVSEFENHHDLQDKDVSRIAERFLLQKIDLSLGPLFAAKLLRVSARESVLLLALDHMISDGASTGILCRELCTIYENLSHNSMVSLPHPTLQFADLAVWQARVQRQRLNEHEAYWKRYLLGAPRVRLHTDNEGKDPPDRTATTLHVPLGAPLSAELQRIAQSTGTLTSLAVLTIYIALMSRWLGLEELLLYMLLHRRCRPELHGMVGPIAGVTLLRMRTWNQDTFLDLMARVRSEFYTVGKHQVFDLQPPGHDLIETDLMFTWLPDPAKSHQRSDLSEDDVGIKVQPFDIWLRRNKTLKVVFSETSAGIVATIVYRETRVSTTAIDRLRQFLLRLSREFVCNPRSRIPPLPQY
jgi:hypothetical protein